MGVKILLIGTFLILSLLVFYPNESNASSHHTFDLTVKSVDFLNFQRNYVNVLLVDDKFRVAVEIGNTGNAVSPGNFEVFIMILDASGTEIKNGDRNWIEPDPYQPGDYFVDDYSVFTISNPGDYEVIVGVEHLGGDSDIKNNVHSEWITVSNTDFDLTVSSVDFLNLQNNIINNPLIDKEFRVQVEYENIGKVVSPADFGLYVGIYDASGKFIDDDRWTDPDPLQNGYYKIDNEAVFKISNPGKYEVIVGVEQLPGDSDISNNVLSKWITVSGNTQPTDSDGDGIDDVIDQCPSQAETYNGFQDADGCPDAPRSQGTDAQIFSDKSNYIIGNSAVLTLIDPDLNTDPDIADSMKKLRLLTKVQVNGVNVGSLLDMNPTNSEFGETGDDTGIFSTVIDIPKQIGSKSLKAGDKITIQYLDFPDKNGGKTWVSTSFSIMSIPGSGSPGSTQNNPPFIFQPADITSSTNVVTFSVKAMDTEDQDISHKVVCNPTSGSTFPSGTTTVTCSVTDSGGNKVSTSFKVTVSSTGLLTQPIRITTDEATIHEGDTLIVYGTATPNESLKIDLINSAGVVVHSRNTNVDSAGEFRNTLAFMKITPDTPYGEYKITASSTTDSRYDSTKIIFIENKPSTSKTKIILEKPRENILIDGILPFKGKLTTEDGNPIPGAEVDVWAIVDLQFGILVTDITDQNGEFSMAWKVKSISSEPTIEVLAGFGGNRFYDSALSDPHKITIGKSSFSLTTEKLTYESDEIIPLNFKGIPLDNIEIVITSKLGEVYSKTGKIQQNGLLTWMINVPWMPQEIVPAGDYTITATSAKLGVEEIIKITINEPKASKTTDVWITPKISSTGDTSTWYLGGVKGILLYGEGLTVETIIQDFQTIYDKTPHMIEHYDESGLVFKNVPFDPSFEYYLLIELTDDKYFSLMDLKNDYTNNGVITTKPIPLLLDFKEERNFVKIEVDKHLPYVEESTNYFLIKYYIYKSWVIDFYTNYLDEKPTFVGEAPFGFPFQSVNDMWTLVSASTTKDILEKYESAGNSKSESFKNAIILAFMPAAIADHIGYHEGIWVAGIHLEDRNRLYTPENDMTLATATLLWDMADVQGERWSSLSEDSAMPLKEAWRIITLAQVNNVKDLYDYLITHYDYILTDGKVGPHEKKVVEHLFAYHYMPNGEPSVTNNNGLGSNWGNSGATKKCEWISTTESTRVRVCSWQ